MCAWGEGGDTYCIKVLSAQKRMYACKKVISDRQVFVDNFFLNICFKKSCRSCESRHSMKINGRHKEEGRMFIVSSHKNVLYTRPEFLDKCRRNLSGKMAGKLR